jgi:hypothetical protein
MHPNGELEQKESDHEALSREGAYIYQLVFIGRE